MQLVGHRDHVDPERAQQRRAIAPEVGPRADVVRPHECLHRRRSYLESPEVRIATWNVNSLNARLPRVEAWLGECQTDLLCMQETKPAAPAFPPLTFHWR